jgi:hypothetical protein
VRCRFSDGRGLSGVQIDEGLGANGRGSAKPALQRRENYQGGFEPGKLNGSSKVLF